MIAQTTLKSLPNLPPEAIKANVEFARDAIQKSHEQWARLLMSPLFAGDAAQRVPRRGSRRRQNRLSVTWTNLSSQSWVANRLTAPTLRKRQARGTAWFGLGTARNNCPSKRWAYRLFGKARAPTLRLRPSVAFSYRMSRDLCFDEYAYVGASTATVGFGVFVGLQLEFGSVDDGFVRPLLTSVVLSRTLRQEPRPF
jgi:hypothetical protein